MKLYEREVLFYQKIAASLTKVKTPECYFAKYTPNGDHIILLKDLSSESFVCGDAVEGCGLEKACAVAKYYAHLHSLFWNSEAFSEGGEFALVADKGFYEVRENMTENSWKLVWPTLKAEFKGVPLEYLAAVEKIDHKKLWAAMRAKPFTIIHGDQHLNNILFREEEPVLLDWQLLQQANGARDIVNFLVYSLNVEESGNKDWNTVAKVYYDALIEYGVTDYTWEEYHKHFGISFLFSLVCLSGLATMKNEKNKEELTPQQDRLQKLQQAIFVRLAYRLKHWDGANLVDLVDQYLA